MLGGGGCGVERGERADGVAGDDSLIARRRLGDVAGEVDHLLPPELHAVRLLDLRGPSVPEHAERVDSESSPRQRGDGVAPVVGMRAEAVDEHDDRAVVVLSRGDVVAHVPAPLPERPAVCLEREPLHSVGVRLERRHGSRRRRGALDRGETRERAGNFAGHHSGLVGSRPRGADDGRGHR